MSKRSTPGERAIQRLAARSEGGVRRRTLGDGGQVYSGPTATRALKALGARAMTMDKDIFVAEDFDEDKPEDQALYAHERHHQMEHGSVDAGAHSYAEEQAAQTIERMVLHRSRKGENFGAIMRDVNSNRIHRSSSSGGSSESPGETRAKSGQGPDSTSEAVRAYMAMRNQGMSHEQIVREMAEKVEEALERANRSSMINGMG